MNFNDLAMLLSKIKVNPSEFFETEILEFKEYIDEKAMFNANELVEEIVALANKKGGNVIIGIRDSSNAKGIWSSQLVGFQNIDISKAIERIKGKIQPKIEINLIEYIYESKNFLVINIPHRRDQIFATSSGKFYIRDGKSSRPFTPSELENHVKSLQTYDWSSQSVELTIEEALSKSSVEDAFTIYKRDRSISEPMSLEQFLEAIGVTKNGILTKGGLLFLGKSEIIKKQFGIFEFRFSWKTKNGALKINEVWSENLWLSIQKGKKLFNECNTIAEATYKSKKYKVPLLDEIAFHEAYLNALVHRDYSVEGMVSITFFDKKLIVTSPGTFYGGITSQNITHHEPRHRNKDLAQTLMLYYFIDRAGMGVFRMGIHSLKYGRKFPIFRSFNNNVEVIMQGEYFIPPIFALTQDHSEDMGIIEMLLLNILYETGYVSVKDLLSKLKPFNIEPWKAVLEVLENKVMSKIIELAGNRNGVFIKVKDSYLEYLKVSKKMKITAASEKHVKLFTFMMKHKNATNEDITKLLKYKHSSQTSTFLRNLEYVKKKKTGVTSFWALNFTF